MRKIKATIEINKDGKVVGATTKEPGYLDEEERSQATAVDGYILVPLKKNRARNKGSGFERVIAKKFSKWLYGTENVLRRTPLSGGWGQDKMGDVCIDPSIMKSMNISHAPNMYIEAKFQEGILGNEFFNFAIGGHKTRINKWLEEIYKIVGDTGKPWFLIMKDNHAQPVIVTSITNVGISPPINIKFLCVFPMDQLEVFILPQVKDKILA